MGRLRLDSALDNGLAFGSAATNCSEGAALNAVQIAGDFAELIPRVFLPSRRAVQMNVWFAG